MGGRSRPLLTFKRFHTPGSSELHRSLQELDSVDASDASVLDPESIETSTEVSDETEV